MALPTCEVIAGDAFYQLPLLEAESIQCCVTSPPYYGLRDYGHPNQIGSEDTPEQYVEQIVRLGQELRRVLKPDGTFWLNLGDSYYNYRPGAGQQLNKQTISKTRQDLPTKCARRGTKLVGFKEKDRLMIPARCAIALQEDGWYLRDEIVWYKTSPMPESVTDRTSKAHEMIYLLTKNKDYYYNAEAIKVPFSPETLPRMKRGVSENNKYVQGAPGQTAPTMNQPRLNSKYSGQATKDYDSAGAQNPSDVKRRVEESILNGDGMANKKSVWTVSTAQFPGHHFATYPPDLIKPCILAGSRPGDTILDPFAGSGTTGYVANGLGRNAILIELNHEYLPMIRERCCMPLFDASFPDRYKETEQPELSL